MHFDHDGRDAVRLGVRLANEPPTDPGDLAGRCRDAGLRVERSVTAEDLSAVGDFLREWTTVADATEPSERAIALNSLLRRYAAAPTITDHAGDGWHLHFREDGVGLGQQLAVLVSVGTALHLTGRGISRLGRCAEPACPRLYADVSKNGRQRYCSPACGNRAAVRRHRGRLASR